MLLLLYFSLAEQSTLGKGSSVIIPVDFPPFPHHAHDGWRLVHRAQPCHLVTETAEEKASEIITSPPQRRAFAAPWYFDDAPLSSKEPRGPGQANSHCPPWNSRPCITQPAQFFPARWVNPDATCVGDWIERLTIGAVEPNGKLPNLAKAGDQQNVEPKHRLLTDMPKQQPATHIPTAD